MLGQRKTRCYTNCYRFRRDDRATGYVSSYFNNNSCDFGADSNCCSDSKHRPNYYHPNSTPEPDGYPQGER